MYSIDEAISVWETVASTGCDISCTDNRVMYTLRYSRRREESKRIPSSTVSLSVKDSETETRPSPHRRRVFRFITLSGRPPASVTALLSGSTTSPYRVGPSSPRSVVTSSALSRCSAGCWRWVNWLFMTFTFSLLEFYKSTNNLSNCWNGWTLTRPCHVFNKEFTYLLTFNYILWTQTWWKQAFLPIQQT